MMSPPASFEILVRYAAGITPYLPVAAAATLHPLPQQRSIARPCERHCRYEENRRSTTMFSIKAIRD